MFIYVSFYLQTGKFVLLWTTATVSKMLGLKKTIVKYAIHSLF